MDTLHRFDDRLFADVNDLARHSRRTFPAPVSLPGTWEPMAVGTLAA